MCGIAGIVSKQLSESSTSESLLSNMIGSLSHRGPDHQGVSCFQQGGFAHSRLSIIDLDPRSHQPFWSEDGQVTLTFNGEIYNFREIKKQLMSKGFNFHTSSDTEVLLQAYRAWGVEAFEKLRGIFAFGLWDQQKKTLFLVRDPVGVKPAYYCQMGDELLFASEIKALLQHPKVSTSPDYHQLNHFFSFGYTACPDTGLEAIKQVNPGHYVTFDHKGVHETRYWNWTDQQATFTNTQALQAFENQFEASVSSQLVSDAPMTCFLSGGLDSSALAWSLSKDQSNQISLFSFGFEEDHHDESMIAQQTARHLGQNLEIVREHGDFRDLPRTISHFLEDPMADSSSLAMYVLCQAASKKFKVALSGDGADELLGGYPTYQATALANRLEKCGLGILSPALKAATQKIPPSSKPYGLQQLSSRFANAMDLKFPENHAAWRSHFNRSLKSQIYSEHFIERIKGDYQKPIGQYATASQAMPHAKQSWLRQCLSMDFSYYLLNDMLTKVDRMSMAHGLEVRVPFLDTDLINLCFQLPDSQKFSFGLTRSKKKVVLRNFLKGKIPQSTIKRKKHGFTVPLYENLQAYWIHDLSDLISTHHNELSQFFQIDGLRSMIKQFQASEVDYRYELFDILMFCYWMENLKGRFQR